ncbi:MAG: hypothetical protein AAFR29_06435 [Pseudomonadota bacterium]
MTDRALFPRTARQFAEQLTIEMIGIAADIRQRSRQGLGERGASGLAAAAVALEDIRTPDGDTGPKQPGTRTATRCLPKVLADLSRDDPARRAALHYAAAHEIIGSMGSAANLIGSPSGGGNAFASDGGMTRKLQAMAMVRLGEGIANRWAWSRADRRFVRGAPRVVMAPQRQVRGLRRITGKALLDAVAVNGCDIADVLRAHGWSNQKRVRDVLAQDLLQTLEKIAKYSDQQIH